LVSVSESRIVGVAQGVTPRACQKPGADRHEFVERRVVRDPAVGGRADVGVR
jgi:hypothetical protein